MFTQRFRSPPPGRFVTPFPSWSPTVHNLLPTRRDWARRSYVMGRLCSQHRICVRKSEWAGNGWVLLLFSISERSASAAASCRRSARAQITSEVFSLAGSVQQQRDGTVRSGVDVSEQCSTYPAGSRDLLDRIICEECLMVAREASRIPCLLSRGAPSWSCPRIARR